jgi:threonine synthase
MKELRRNILHCIGSTSLLALRRVAPASGARILLKLEGENPTGSMKDRMALAMIEAAEADGRLGRRIYRRQHRRFALAGLRSKGISAAYRDVGCLRARKTRSHANARRQA